MANQAGPVCRLCRREGAKLYLKGSKCLTNCTFDKRSGLLPGQHGLARRRKASDYGIQLRAKQKARRIYGLLEKQFRNYFEKAARTPGVTGELLLQQLERRLDNVAFRLGFAVSRRQARQVVRHGHVQVNGRKVNIPSFQVSVGDEIAIREGSKKLVILEAARDFTGNQNQLNWLEIDRENYKGKVLSLPKRDEIQTPVNEQLIVELYSK